MRALLIRLLGLRTLAVGAAVVAFAPAAGGATLTVYTTDTANYMKNLFAIGETILLKVTGDTQGATAIGIQGQLLYNATITTTVVSPTGCNGSFLFPCTTPMQGNWLTEKGSLFPSDGTAFAFNQTTPPSFR